MWIHACLWRFLKQKKKSRVLSNLNQTEQSVIQLRFQKEMHFILSVILNSAIQLTCKTNSSTNWIYLRWSWIITNKRHGGDSISCFQLTSERSIHSTMPHLYTTQAWANRVFPKLQLISNILLICLIFLPLIAKLKKDKMYGHPS